MFRPYSLTSLGAWTAGALAGNRAYYSTKQKQEIQRVADVLADDYLMYRDYGGELDVIQWLEEKKMHMQLTPQEVAVRVIILEFQGRKLPLQDLAKFVICHLNIFLNENHVQYKAFKRRPYDWLDNDTLFPLWDSFRQQFFADGLPEQDANIEAAMFLGLRIDEKRLREFIDFVKAKFAPQQTQVTTAVDQRAEFTKELYISRDSQTLGPYGFAQLQGLLKAGVLKSDDLVAYDNAPTWLKLKDFMASVKSGKI